MFKYLLFVSHNIIAHRTRIYNVPMDIGYVHVSSILYNDRIVQLLKINCLKKPNKEINNIFTCL